MERTDDKTRDGLEKPARETVGLGAVPTLFPGPAPAGAAGKAAAGTAVVASAKEAFWTPAPAWSWDVNRTHRIGFLNPISVFTRIVPRSINHGLAVGLGSVLAFAMRKTRRVLRHNLVRVGRGSFTPERVSRLILQTFHNYARYLVDFMAMADLRLEDIPPLFRRFSGTKVFERALARGRGVLLVTPHFGNWELGGAFLRAQGFPLNVVSFVAPDQATVQMREAVRERLGIRHVYVGKEEGPLQMLDILKALRRNEIVAMLCDRSSSDSPVTVDFFGHPFAVPSGPAILAQLTGAPMIPSFVVHRSGMYEAFTGKPILVANPGRDGRDAVVRARTEDLAREFEKVIARFPDQWYNFYPSWLAGQGSDNGRPGP